jgi:hypothetical protein
MPAELWDEILKLLIRDHDPERGNKIYEGGTWQYAERPHFFLSLASMNKQLHANVESFCGNYIKLSMPWINNNEDESTTKSEVNYYRLKMVGGQDPKCFFCGSDHWSHRMQMMNGL